MGQLSKKSDSSDIKKYFEAICNLQASGKEFPVSLEDVWPLVYNRKDYAVKALVESDLFIQDADYQFFRQKAENSGRGRSSGEYWLSIPCLEFFIARKKREVFEVYRQVFHKAMNPVMSESDALVDTVQHIMSLPVDNRIKSDLIKRINHTKPGSLPDYRNTELYPATIGPKGEPVPLDEDYGPARSSATKLLRRHKSSICVEEFNDILCRMGYLERRRVGWKSYCVVVGDGCLYGCNVPNPYYKDQTTPMYWEDSFHELLTIVLNYFSI